MISTPVPPGAIVVGVDGSPNSDLGLGWAIGEATRRGLPLHIIHAFSYGYPMTNNGIGDAVESLRHRADGVYKKGCRPGASCEPEAAHHLGRVAIRAGTNARGGIGGGGHCGGGRSWRECGTWVLMGSVSVQVAAHARCHVVVVRDSPSLAAAGAPVVVGVDGSALSTNAIAYAYAQASSRGVGLTVVHRGGWSVSREPRARPHGTSTGAQGSVLRGHRPQSQGSPRRLGRHRHLRRATAARSVGTRAHVADRCTEQA